MLFNSPQFLFCYLPIVLVGFALLGRLGRRAIVAWLAFASLAFYAYWRPAFLFLLGGSITINYVCAFLIWRSRPRMQKFWLVTGIMVNLGALGFFKYLFPFLHLLNASGLLHQNAGDVILPLGISFFTFTQIAYLVDLSQGAAERQDFLSYVLFVTFFPHLIAGPILHHSEIMPQFSKDRNFRLRWNDVAIGLSWFVLGLAKKVLIADRIAPFADRVFAHPAGLSLTESWIGVLNYAMQLYFDFSGYCDMAMGLARIFSIRFPFNFDSPYKAANIIEFWQRWHMTLTRYLTLYVYNPISITINRRRMSKGKSISRKATKTWEGFGILVAFPTILTMFIAGIWHGAGFQFLIFGILHGIYLSINHAWRIFAPAKSRLVRVATWRPISVLITFLAVCVAQVFFRSNSTQDALRLLRGMFGGNGVGLLRSPLADLASGSWRFGDTTIVGSAQLLPAKAYLVFLVLPIVWFLPNTQEILRQADRDHVNPSRLATFVSWRPTLLWAGSLGILFIAVLWKMTDTSSFLYFQF